MASNFWGSSMASMFSGGASGTKAKAAGAPPSPAGVTKASPQLGNTGPNRPPAGDMVGDSITGDIDMDDLFGQPPPNMRNEEPRTMAPSNGPPPMRPSPVTRPAPKDGSAEVPDWLMAKVDGYITNHFYELEAQIKAMNKMVTDVALQVQKREDKVSEVLQQVKMLIELQFSETKKGLSRDNEVQQVCVEFARLREEVQGKTQRSIDELKFDMGAFATTLEGHGEAMMLKLDEKLRQRDDATYRFEADLMSIKKSFSSLRLEFQKSKKAQDFKNTSTSVFFLKAIDMKPDERKRILRTLTEQEEKNRGAVVAAEKDLREHEDPSLA